MKTIELAFEWLKKQGLQPKYNDHNDIEFVYQNRIFLYFDPEDDEAYFKLALPGVCELTEDTREAMLEIANELNSMYKLSKTLVAGDNVWIVIETFVDNDPDLEELMPRSIATLIETQENLYVKINQ